MPTPDVVAFYVPMAAVFLAVVGLTVTIYFRQGRMEATLESIQKQIDIDGNSTRTEIRHLVNALTTHRHSGRGRAYFRTPLLLREDPLKDPVK